ncbi:MAG: hypothetical protein NZM04_09830 [Methylacidiphilales bacterium]|nr:hypothetical protein [Candidatus Methylacidiphilales bacterium]
MNPTPSLHTAPREPLASSHPSNIRARQQPPHPQHPTHPRSLKTPHPPTTKNSPSRNPHTNKLIASLIQRLQSPRRSPRGAD